MDPLKPLGSLVRSVWSKTVRRTEKREASVSTTSTSTLAKLDAPASTAAVEPLRGRLRQRIAAIENWDADHAREIFVESVLLSELGEDLVRDTACGELVKKLSQQLAMDSALSHRLDSLLRKMRNDE